MIGLLYWLAGSLFIGLPLALIYRKGAMQQIEQNVRMDTLERRAIIKYTMIISIVVWPYGILCLLGSIFELWFGREENEY